MMYLDNLAPELEALARRAAQAEGVDIGWIELKRQGGSWVFRVFVDSLERTVDLNDCERVSRRLGVLLDVEDPIEGAYTLEVSTPGLDRPLHGEKDFLRFEGALARVKLNKAMDGQKRFLGRLSGMDGDSLILTLADSLRRAKLPISDIESARLEVDLESAPPRSKERP